MLDALHEQVARIVDKIKSYPPRTPKMKVLDDEVATLALFPLKLFKKKTWLE